MNIKIENFKITDKDLKGLNKIVGRNFSDDVSPLLELTVKNMRKGLSFDNSFKTAMDTIMKTYERIENIESSRKIAVDYMFQELYQKGR